MRFFITTAIDYVNSAPHLGTAYEKITADVIARHMRARGMDVHFLMGNDEHSIKVAQAAEKKGMSPLAHCDEMEAVFRRVWTELGVQPDDFIRTTEERHKKAVREMVDRIHAAGDLYQGHYEGHYCEGCEAFKNDGDLIEGRCPLHPHLELKWLEERNWFFRLSQYTEPLQAFYAANPGFLEPERRKNEILALLGQGLQDISVSRSGQNWGVAFPFDPSSVVYVWFDALINYIAAIGFPGDPATFERYWPADLHVIGKDITRFHCVIWPAMLLSAGLPLPKKVFGHGFVNMGGDRMSKSAGRSADPSALAKTYGADALRWFLCVEAAYGQDLDWSEERLIARANSELANGFGNLASRTMAMTEKYFGGRVGRPPEDSALLAFAKAAVTRCEAAMDQLDLRGAAQAAYAIVEESNLYIDRTKPFVMAKDPSQHAALQSVLAELANAVLIATRLLFPFIPEKSKILHEALAGQALDETTCVSHAASHLLDPERILQKGPALFPRFEAKSEP